MPNKQLKLIEVGEPEKKEDSADTQARQALFQALADIWGHDVKHLNKQERGALNAAVDDLFGPEKKNATPIELYRVARRYCEKWPQAIPTPSALAKHWDTFADKRVLRNTVQPGHAEETLATKRQKMLDELNRRWFLWLREMADKGVSTVIAMGGKRRQECPAWAYDEEDRGDRMVMYVFLHCEAPREGFPQSLRDWFREWYRQFKQEFGDLQAGKALPSIELAVRDVKASENAK